MPCTPPSAQIREQLDTPVVERVAVVVCGGGPAGIAAAIAAARMQRRLGLDPSVRLIEVHGQLGGIWTSGLLSWILDGANKTGLMKQIIEAVEAYRLDRGGRARGGSGQLYDPEHMKVFLEDLCHAAGVRIRLHTRVASVHRTGRQLTHILTESKSGREAFAADCFIDCSGDGDLAAQAGCEYEFGRLAGVDQGSCQPMTLMAMVSGIDTAAAAPFHDRVAYTTAEVKAAMWRECQRAGLAPSYSHPTLFQVYPDLFAIMANHEYGRDPRDAQQLTDATIAARRELHELIGGLRALGGPWRGLRIIATAAQIGIRESRRPMGRYRITLDDLAVGRQHPDAVCECRFGIDVHSTSPMGTGSVEPKPVPRMLPYDIPYRALVARDVDNLLMAGRCISGDFYAHASYRVTGNAVPMGEAAGSAAAIAAHQHRRPADLDYPRDVRPLQAEVFDHAPARPGHRVLRTHSNGAQSARPLFPVTQE